MVFLEGGERALLSPGLCNASESMKSLLQGNTVLSCTGSVRFKNDGSSDDGVFSEKLVSINYKWKDINFHL